MDAFFIMLVIFIILFVKSPTGKGLIGEIIINIAIKIRLDKEDYILLKDVTLPVGNGTTQIDHIIVSRYGIFVIETKNMKGWIFGGEHQKTWTQSIYKKKNKFQNPLLQNYKHTKAIESVLGLNKEQVFSVIVFVGDSTFKTDMPNNVVYAGGLFRYISSKTQTMFSRREIKDMTVSIESGRLARTRQTNKDHVSYLKKKSSYNITPSYRKSSVTSCPRCDGNLVMRTAKRGANKGMTFYGCTNYPRCKHTQQ